MFKLAMCTVDNQNWARTYADRFVSSGPPPAPTTTMSNVGMVGGKEAKWETT
jgi:hypothetical protein